MAHGVDFKGSNFTFNPPAGREDVQPLKAFVNGSAIVTAWQLSDEELDEILRTRVVFLGTLSGRAFYPTLVGSASVIREMVADTGPTIPKQE